VRAFGVWEFRAARSVARERSGRRATMHHAMGMMGGASLDPRRPMKGEVWNLVFRDFPTDPRNVLWPYQVREIMACMEAQRPAPAAVGHGWLMSPFTGVA
jgi:hypothetical protein